MGIDNEEFLRELLNDFRVEAAEHHSEIVNGLLELEKKPDTSNYKSIIEKVFRETHSLKGAARAVNLVDIEKICMSLESVFNCLKKGELMLLPPMFDVFYKAVDIVGHLIKNIDNKQQNRQFNLPLLVGSLDLIVKGSKPQINNSQLNVNNSVNPVSVQQDISISAFESQKTPKSNDNDTVRISIGKLDTLFRQSEEFISIKSSLQYLTNELNSLSYQLSLYKKRLSDTHIVIKDCDLKSIEDHITYEKTFIKRQEDDLNRVSKELDNFTYSTARMIDDLILGIKTTLLSQFSTLTSIVPKIIRDLSKEHDKEIKLTITGDAIEIDRRILEELKDPLIHIIRNCVDHGIEQKKDRVATGKAEVGCLNINIERNFDRKIHITVEDDGAGIDTKKIIQSAIKNGAIGVNDIDNLSDKDILKLVFTSGVSTKNFITDISGRGIGMAIVHEKIEKLGGEIYIESKLTKGTKFIIDLPQTLATFRGVVVNVSDQLFVVPSTSVEKVIRIKLQEIKTVESKKTILYGNETLSLIHLSELLNIKKSRKRSNLDNYLPVLVVTFAQKRVALIVDLVLGENEGIIKDLGPQLLHVNNITGATILGNGQIVPIINTSELINSASSYRSSGEMFVTNNSENSKEETKKVLIAEDSITIRSMLKSFVENAGYQVKTAVDGQDALYMLNNEPFDLVVSDIEMPRMNGFELTSRIKEDKILFETPVILVTALESAEDQKRGLDCGANAYIVKSSFEKSNLIDTIRRLI